MRISFLLNSVLVSHLVASGCTKQDDGNSLPNPPDDGGKDDGGKDDGGKDDGGKDDGVGPVDLQPKVTLAGVKVVSASVAAAGKPVTYKLEVDAGKMLTEIGGDCPIGKLYSYIDAAAEYETGAIDKPCSVEFNTGSPLAFKNPFIASSINALGRFPMKPAEGASFTKDNRKAEVAVAKGTIAVVNRPAPLKSAFDSFDTTIPTPEYESEETIGGDCPQPIKLGELYVFGPVTADCKVIFNIANPCGETGLTDPEESIVFTSANSSATNRIDRIMASTSVTAANGSWKGLNPADGLGKASCAASGCHGKAISSGLPSTTGELWKYDSKYWRVWYDGAANGTVYVPDLSKLHDGDITKFERNTDNAVYWKEKLLFQRTNLCGSPDNKIYSENGSEYVTAEADPAWHAYDPLNSRFYRKLTASHYRADIVDDNSSAIGGGKCGAIPDLTKAPLRASARMPRSSTCTSTDSSGCLTDQQQAMMCHWIWNGAK